MRNVYVLGAAMMKFGRYPAEMEVPELASQAALLALKDAGMTMKDIQLLASGNLYQSNGMIGQRILHQIGQTGIPVLNVANACATGSTAFREAYFAVGSGEFDVAMAIGSEKMGKGGLLGGGGGRESVEGILGSGLMPAVFGQAGVEHMRLYGTKMEHFAKISVKNHKNSTKNPLSHYQNEVSLEEVMQARMIAYPNTLMMCCPNTDGAAAIVLVSEAVMKKSANKPVKVAASVLTSDPYTDRDLTLPDVSTLTRTAAKIAYEKAGVGPEDLDLVELHDCFATAELLHYENLGLCKDGEAARGVDEGWFEAGGKSPVNVSGGLLSKGHPLGATGVANIVEIVTHLRGAAGARQGIPMDRRGGLARVLVAALHLRAVQGRGCREVVDVGERDLVAHGVFVCHAGSLDAVVDGLGRCTALVALHAARLGAKTLDLFARREDDARHLLGGFVVTSLAGDRLAGRLVFVRLATWSAVGADPVLIARRGVAA